MLVHEEYALDPDGACRLIAAHGWATIVTAGPTGIRATYGFCLLEPEDGQGITVLGHIARADPQAADLIAGASTLLIFNGPHGYVSASWYRPTMTQVPSTWNYTAVHLRGTPVMLTGDEAFEVLRRTLDRHEALLPEGERWTLHGPALDFARKIAPGTAVFRLTSQDIEAKAKMSQDKPAAIGAAVIDRLERPGPHQNLDLADAMRDSLQQP